MTERFVTSEIVKYDWRVAVSPSRGTRVVKGWDEVPVRSASQVGNPVPAPLL